MVGEEELLCPHCGAAQIPQYSRTQLGAVIGGAREGAPRLSVGVGCLVGLLAGFVLAACVADFDPGAGAGPRQWKLQGEVVFLMMIGGIVLGLVYAQWQSLRRRKRRDPRGGPPAA
jgi:hypothetical protein